MDSIFFFTKIISILAFERFSFSFLLFNNSLGDFLFSYLIKQTFQAAIVIASSTAKPI